jgi:signal transduction histidine kinase
VKWRPDSIQSRIVAIAMLPALVLALGLGGYMIIQHQGDLENDLKQRGHLLARQLAAASDYGVFSGNTIALQSVVDSVGAEVAVAGVVVTDRSGRVLASKGHPIVLSAATLSLAPQRRDEKEIATAKEWIFFEPVRSPALLVDDIGDAYTTTETTSVTEARGYVGTVAVALTTATIADEKRQFAVAVASMLVTVLIGAGFFARRMSGRVSRPIIDVALAVERIGRGEHGVRVKSSTIGVLHRLGDGVNQMALRLERSMQDLESRVAAATRELSARRDEAERADQAKTRFLAAASHDLRQPMHALGMFVAALNEPRPEAERAALLSQVNRAVLALGDLLDSLLDISRLDGGRVEANVAALALQELFDHIRLCFLETAESKGIELVVRRTSYWVRSDRLLLERMLTNLVSNAIAYTRTGRIAIVARKRGQHVRIEVRDSGIGIAADAQERIFDEFVQLHNPERDRSKGIGLGLAIVKRLATLLDHPLHLRSCPGMGSVFALDVPRSIAQPGISAMQFRAMDEATRLDLRVLVIDDDPLVRASIGGLLVDWGCDVHLEPGDRDLPKRLAGEYPAPNVILCDLRLADGLAGTDLIAAVQAAIGQSIPAIVITGDTDPSTLREVRHTGCIVLSKPVRPAQLRAVLRTSGRSLGQRTTVRP